ncbi:hypothetical protein, partial [Plasmodium yoelii yoelii]
MLWVRVVLVGPIFGLELSIISLIFYNLNTNLICVPFRMFNHEMNIDNPELYRITHIIICN